MARSPGTLPRVLRRLAEEEAEGRRAEAERAEKEMKDQQVRADVVLAPSKAAAARCLAKGNATEVALLWLVTLPAAATAGWRRRSSNC